MGKLCDRETHWMARNEKGTSIVESRGSDGGADAANAVRTPYSITARCFRPEVCEGKC